MGNDGSLAAFTATVEWAWDPTHRKMVRNGVFAHTLGIELGSNWINELCQIPQIPLEIYNCTIDLGVYRFAVCPLKTNAPDAYKALIDEKYLVETDGGIRVVPHPKDIRKALLEYLMVQACFGRLKIEQAFREIRRCLYAACFVAGEILKPASKSRILFGRFVKKNVVSV